jgi:hypothetical protein
MEGAIEAGERAAADAIAALSDSAPAPLADAMAPATP